MADEKNEKQQKEIVGIPAINYFHAMYGRSFEGNDQKAADVFRLYESKEKLNSLRVELQWVKEGRVSKKVCDGVIGKRRLGRFKTYEEWAALMLKWLAVKKG